MTKKYILRALGSTLIHTVTNRDIPSRLRLHVLRLVGVPTRVLLAAQVLRDSTLRLVLAVLSLRDVSALFRLSATLLRSLPERLILASLVARDTLSRVRVLATLQRSTPTRLVLASILARHLPLRVHLGITVRGDISIRSLVLNLSPVQRDIAAYLELDASSYRHVLTRLLLKISPSTGIVLSPLPQPVGFRGIGVGPGVGQPADTIGGRRQ